MQQVADDVRVVVVRTRPVILHSTGAWGSRPGPAQAAGEMDEGMRFGMFVPQGWRMDLVGIEPAQQWEAMVSLAKHADDGDVLESIWVYDHFHTVPQPSGEATHEAWSLMARFGAATSRVRLGQMCTCMAYRNPAYLAKVAATVDVISGGRVEMGIGGGWYEHEWRAYGYGFPRPVTASARCARASRSSATCGPRDRRRSTGSTTRSTARSAQPRPLQGTTPPGQRPQRHPDVDRRRRREGDAEDRGPVRRLHELRRHRPRASTTRARSSRATATTSAATSATSSARPTTTSSSARPRRTSRTGWPGSRTPTARPGCPTRRSARRRRTCAAVPRSGRRSRSSRHCRASRSWG